MALKEDKKLFTPGPLNTSLQVKESMLHDLGSRDKQFIDLIKNVRVELLDVAGVSADDWTAVLLQGSGTFAVEAVIQTALPRQNGRVLVLVNGAYGRRIVDMCKIAGIETDVIQSSEILPFDISKVETQLRNGGPYSLVAIVHCETSSGVINNIQQVADLVRKVTPDTFMFVDAMSSFGAIPLDLSCVDFMVSSANKCLQGVPGFAYAISRKAALQKCKGNSRCLSLDLVAQEENLVKTGQFRFTFPTHTLLAFGTALAEFKKEGGVEGRARRYAENNACLIAGMKEMGFRTLVPVEHASYIITCFIYPTHENFNFQQFYSRLSDLGQVIYPGKITEAQCFRIGNIGHLFKKDIEVLLAQMKNVLTDMEIPLPVQ